MNVYVFYTENMEAYVELLQESVKRISYIRIIPLLYQDSHNHVNPGDTHDQNYMNLMVKRWEIHTDNVKDNLGKNIVILDSDCVFNPNHQDFCPIIEKNLQENDFCFQFDSNNSMSCNVNMGFSAVKCSHKTLSFYETWLTLIKNKPNSERIAGFPQLEWNNLLKENSEIKFKILPECFGYNNKDCRFYHALGQDKLRKLKMAFFSFKKTYEQNIMKSLLEKQKTENY
tara:strand:- start:905 stop:1588 length:684 start_codon:yes stop_codon:yes gene_type:complete